MRLRALLKLLNVERSEVAPIGLLMLYSFFMGISIAFFYTATITFFLGGWADEMAYALPGTYVLSGVLFYVLWLGYSRVERKASFPRLTIIAHLFLLASVGALTWYQTISNERWLSFLMLVWIIAFIYISAVTFWGAASKLFNLIQAKRIFGLIGSGAVLSDMLGFVSIPALLSIEGVESADLFYLAVLAMGACIVIVVILNAKFRKELTAAPASAKTEAEPVAKPTKTSTRDFFRNKYYRLIFTLAILPMIGIYLVDFLFLEQTRTTYEADDLSKFIGLFLAGVAVVELVIKTAVFSRLLNNFGLKVGLLTLPVSMGIATVLAIIAGSIWGVDGALFFPIIALGKLLERVMRSGVHDPSFRILYQPVPEEERMAFQSKIEGIPSAVGNIVAGGLLLGLWAIGFDNALVMNVVLLAVIVFWIFTVTQLYSEYRNTLKGVVRNQRAPKAATPERGSPELHLLNTLTSDENPNKLVDSLTVLEHTDPLHFANIYTQYLEHHSPAVRMWILNKVSWYADVTAFNSVKHIADYDTDSDVTAFARVLVDELQAYQQQRDERTIRGLKSDNPLRRMRMAYLVANSENEQLCKYLMLMLEDPDQEVRWAAVFALGQLRYRESIPNLVRMLRSDYLFSVVSSALIHFGEEYIDQMQAASGLDSISTVAKLRLFKVFGALRSPRTKLYLAGNLDSPNPDIQRQALTSLNYENHEVDMNMFFMVAENIKRITGNIAWSWAAGRDLEGGHEALRLVRTALLAEIRQKRQDVFQYISLISDPRVIQTIMDSLEQLDAQSKVFVLEMIDVLISPDIKKLVIPLIDNDLTIAERLRSLREDFPQEQLTIPERLKDIILCDYPKAGHWTKACAMNALAALKYDRQFDVLVANLFHPSELLYEQAVVGMYRLDKDNFHRCISVIGQAGQDRAVKLTKAVFLDGRDSLLCFDRVVFLKQFTLFRHLPESDLATLCTHFQEHELHIGSEYHFDTTDTDRLFIVFDGTAVYQHAAGDVVPLRRGDFIGEFAIFKSEVGCIVKAESRTVLFSVEKQTVFALLAANPKNSKYILKLVKKQMRQRVGLLAG